MFKAVLGWIRQARLPSLFLFLVVGFSLVFAVFYHSGSQPSGLSTSEVMARNSSQSFTDIYHNPVNAPHKLVILAALKLGLSGHGSLRLSSAVFAIIFALAFYVLARMWFGKSISLFGTVLFLSLPIFIIASRQASANIMYFSPIVILAVYNWLLRTKHNHAAAWLLLVLCCGIFIYVPGLVWWLAGAAVIARNKLIEKLEEIPSWLFVTGLSLFTIMLVPAGLSIVHDWRLVRSFGLIPAHWPHILQLFKNLGWMLSSLFVKTPYHSALIIERLPLLNLIQIALLAIGSYAMWRASWVKALVLDANVVFAVLAAALNNNISLLILGLPAIAVFMAAGLRYLYIEWRSVFPSNPLPKALALTLIACLVAVQLVFGLSYSLLAWPHAVATKSAYVLK